jgi:hypothetical protein
VIYVQSADDVRRRDVLGHTRSLVRYGNPALPTPTLPTTWSWTYDSLGQVLTAAEPEVATRTNTYSSFGELRSVAWTDTTAVPARAMRLEYSYDALGRRLSSVERQDGAAIPNTTYTWTYDTSAGSPHLTSQNLRPAARPVPQPRSARHPPLRVQGESLRLCLE